MSARRSPRGFTVVEILVAVATIGILTSVALPELGRAQLRARAAERRTIMVAIAQSVSDLTLNLGRLPPGGITGNWNPAGAPTTYKRRFDMAAPGWNQLALRVDGNTYYSYRFFVNPSGTNPVTGEAQPTLDVYAAGDLDGDGSQSTKQISYVGFGHSYQLVFEDPEQGAEDQNTF